MSFVLTPTSRLLLPNRRTFLFHRRNAAESFSFSTSSTLTCLNSPAGTRINSAQSCSNSSTDPVDRPENIPIFGLFIPLAFSLVLLCLRLFHGVLLPEFPRRWRELVVLSRAAESRMRAYPAHLWQAVVAYEDRRFFRHCGVDPIGIARAAVSFSARGGGSTITQQMGFLFLFPTAFLSCALLVSGITYSEFVHPNFTASNLQYAENSGSFLTSRNGTFKAAIFNPGAQQTNFYLCVIHVASNTIIWSANRDDPISNSGEMYLTSEGITISDESGNPKWSTPAIPSPAYAMMLSEMGNLVLLDRSNNSLWESFQHPTDTIVMGQLFPVKASFSSAVSPTDLSTGDYSLTLSSSDLHLQWRGQLYWKLSMDTKAYINSNSMVEYMAINRTGLYLLGGNGTVIIQVALSLSDFWIATLESSGRFIVKSFSADDWMDDFVGPSDSCRIPFLCGTVGSCRDGSASNTCSCPSNFHSVSPNRTGCVPTDGSYSLYPTCNSTDHSTHLIPSVLSYLTIGYGYDYFGSQFSGPVRSRVNLTACQDLCSGDCSCLGFLYENSSGDCYWIKSYLGSLISDIQRGEDLLGYIKVLVGSSPAKPGVKNDQSTKFPLSALVLLPSSAFILLIVLGSLWWRRQRISRDRDMKAGQYNLPSPEEPDAFQIPGLPKRFDYKELEVATDHFRTLIGSGGFGAVYKGTLPDKAVVAVKKITNLGIQGKKEFCTEIAIIGNIHHINLVKLRGFCARGSTRLLVFEYMNRGSLDRILFGNGPVLEWQERFNIALGTARGLAYLHSGCEQKIIHCDIKPENILLHDHFQVKISDFGLSKLLGPEQSSLFTTMRGTRGYLAPEWLTNSAISEKTDVYSFGMVLLEIVSGRKNCLLRTQSHSLEEDSSGTRSSSSSGSGLLYFPLFALEMHEQGKYAELADPRLENRVKRQDVEKLVRVALCCVHEEPSLRPNMAIVVGMLEGKIPLGHPRMESLNFLRFYGRRFTEASVIAEQENEENVLLYSQANACPTSTTSSSRKSMSYISSQQVSGPR
ncbi:hypothetical protein CDL15_Pgr003850 [Punica granatum]|uniref:Receptor-like serine/threonine-protein kinase n=1 Tax=Punica granatum TaxID=22663 RepID=A0A218XUF5_PUNGR|nr:hypothetical protein CDL15_Pgr003850 [Punica granatum]